MVDKKYSEIFISYAQFVLDFKKMSQISSSTSSHKKRKYCAEDAIEFVSCIRVASSPLFPFVLSLLSLSCCHIGQPRAIDPRSTARNKVSLYPTISPQSVS